MILSRKPIQTTLDKPFVRCAKRIVAIVSVFGDLLPEESAAAMTSIYAIMATKLIKTIQQMDVANVSSFSVGVSCDVYMLACYFYYMRDEQILEDDVYHALAKSLKYRAAFGQRLELPLTVEDLSAATFLGEYPRHIQVIASHLDMQ